MKLELKHLAYLPYEVKFISTMDDSDDIIRNNKIWTLDGVNKLFGSYCLLTKENSDAYDINTCKLILKPLSDLTKADLINAGFDYQIDWLTHERESHVKYYGSLERFINKTDFGHIQFLISNHYDIYGLIKEGLAININALQHFQPC